MEENEKKELALQIIDRLKKAYPDADCTLDYDDANKDDIIGFLVDRNVPGDEIVYNDLADEILANKPHQGYLTISNALQWRLQYSRVIALGNSVDGVLNYEW